MSLRIGRLETLLLVGFLAGCASTPHPPAAPTTTAASDLPAQNQDAGWLFPQGTGQQTAQSPPPSGVAPATANTPPSYIVGAPAYPGATPASYTSVAPGAASPDSGPLLVPPANATAAMAPGVMPGTSPASAYPPGVAPPAGAYGLPPSAATPSGPAPAPTATAATASSATATAKPKSDDDDGWDWSDLGFDETWKKIEKTFGYGPDEKIAKEQFRQAEALFREKKYAEAAPMFYIASWRWPDTTLEEDAMFLLGECYYFDDQYGKAQDAYDNLLKKHGNTRYLDTVTWRLFAIARYWELFEAQQPHWPLTPNFKDKTRPWFDSWGNAIAAYDSIHMHDPRGPLADVAEMAVANMYFREGFYEDATFHYDIIRKDYPKSRYQIQAHILGLQSKMRSYQGPNYNGQPLKDAGEIADQTLRQFRGRLGDEEARVAATRARIVVMKAEREWTLGQYYDGKQYYGAARQYYKFLVDNYPHTPFADQARARLEQIRNFPDAPPNYFSWLTRVFDHER